MKIVTNIKLKVTLIIVTISLFNVSCKKATFVDNINAALKYQGEDDFEKALIYINKAISLDDNQSFAFVLRGQIQSGLENDSLAIIDFSKAISLNNQNISAYFHRGLSHSILYKEDLAIADFSKAIQMKESAGQILFEVNQQHLDISQQTDVPLNVLKYFRGRSFFDLTKYDQALSDFMDALLGGYNASNCQFQIGYCYIMLGKKSEACSYFYQAKNSGNTDAIEVINKYCISK